MRRAIGSYALLSENIEKLRLGACTFCGVARVTKQLQIFFRIGAAPGLRHDMVHRHVTEG